MLIILSRHQIWQIDFKISKYGSSLPYYIILLVQEVV